MTGTVSLLARNAMVTDVGPSVVRCPSHDLISKTKQDRPIVTVEHQ